MSDFKAKLHQIPFRLGLRPRPHCGSLQHSPDPLDRFIGSTCKGMDRKGRGMEGRKRRGGPGKRGGAYFYGERRGCERRGEREGEGRKEGRQRGEWERRGMCSCKNSFNMPESYGALTAFMS